MWSITRNADVLTDALEQNEIDDPEIADIEDVGYDADGYTSCPCYLPVAQPPEESLMLKTISDASIADAITAPSDVIHLIILSILFSLSLIHISLWGK